ncbi:MAG: hydrogenase maturation protease [Planctomycetota bacterium]
MEPYILIIGFGSTLRGDDAAGPAVAARLAERFVARSGVSVCVEASLTPELAALASAADRVVFIDCAADLAAGEVRQVEVAPTDDTSPAMVHFLDPAALMLWTRRLYGETPAATQFAIGGGSFEASDDLTPIVANACAFVVARVEALVDQWQNTQEVSRA